MIPLFKVHMPESVFEPMIKVMKSGYIGQGEKVDEFERLLADWTDNDNCVTLNNGTAALHLALRLAGVTHGTEVLSSPMTCSATNHPILQQGAKVVWADIEPRTGNISYEDIVRKVNKRTRAIMVVHWGGYPCDLKEINAFARSNGIKVIEDACHAFGSKYKDKFIGSHSDYCCFSFQAIKSITTVDGGLLTCKSYEDYRRAILLRWYGIDRNSKRTDLRCEDNILEYGYKYHMNDVTATIGIEQLKYLPNILSKARANARRYFAELPLDYLMHYTIDRESTCWLFTLYVPERDRFMDYMRENGIATSKVHARNDIHTCYAESRCELVGVDDFYAHEVCIPCGWWLTEDEVNHIIKTVNNYA